MTDVGKIKLGVEIDADNLSAKLSAAVHKAIAPALADLQKELNKVEREYDKVGRASVESATVQASSAKSMAASVRAASTATEAHTAAMGKATEAAGRQATTTTRQRTSNDGLTSSTRRVAGAQNELNAAIDVFGKKSPQAAAAAKRLSSAHSQHTTALLRAAAESRASTDSQINDYERLARAAEESAAKQALADRAGAASGGGRRGPPGGQSGGRGGVLGFLTGPVGLNSIALGAQALPAALTGVTALVGAVQQLGQAGLALPAIYGAVGASIGVAVLGFSGMKDAITALNKAAESGKPEDLKKATEALKDMDPAAVAVAKTLSGLVQGPLKELRKGVQSHMFAGFDKDLQSTADKAIPRLTGNINKIGDAWNGTLKTLTGSLGSEKNLSLFDRFLGNTAKGQTNANKAIDPLVHAFATLMSTGGEFLPRLGDALAKVADRFDNFISKAGASGQLWKWIDEGLNGLRALGNSILNIGKTLTGLTKAAGGDGGFLGWLERATGQMSKFVNSADGQGKLGEFFKGGKEDLHRWAELLSALAPIIGQVLKGFATWGEVTLPIITALAQVIGLLNQIPGLVQAGVVAFLAYRTVGPILGKLGIGGGAAGAAGGAGGGLLGGGRAMRGFMGLGLGIAANGVQQQSQADNDVTGQIGGALGTVGAGALIGSSILPGVGTAVGAGVGAAIASVTYLMGEDAKAAKIASDAHAVLADQMLRGKAAAEAMRDAQMSLNNDLLNSKGKIDAGAVGAVGERIKAIPDSLTSLDPKVVEQVSASIKQLGLDQQQLATITANGGPAFDALVASLNRMGPAGAIAAQQLQQIRNATQSAADAGATAGPILQTLADAFTGGNLDQAAANLRLIFNSIPTGDALNASMAGISGPGGLLEMIRALGGAVSVGPGGILRADAISPEVLQQLQQITGKIIEINQNGEIRIQTNQASTQLGQLDQQLNTFMAQYRNMLITPQIAPVQLPGGIPNLGIPGQAPDIPGVPGRPRADGGQLPGYSPGVDNMLVPMSGGEGVVIPEAMRALGPDWLYGVNSAFRRGLSRSGYAMGGVVGGFAGGGVFPGADDTTEIGLLTQIRDLLAGRSGASPLNTMANSTEQLARNQQIGMVGGLGGGGMGGLTGGIGPFGTPIRPHNSGYDALAAALQAWGMDPTKFIGEDPAQYYGQGGAGMSGRGGRGGGMPMGTADFARNASVLSQFARSGSLGDVSGLGLDANDPVIRAIVSARNKKKGGLADDQIADLIAQVVGAGGYSGTLDSTNSSLISSLQTYREKLAKGGGMLPQAGIPGAGLGMPGAAASGFTPGGAGNAQALIAFAQAANGGKYAAASDLAGGLADCSGAVSDLVEFLTQGKSSPARLFDTHSEAGVLRSLGAVPGLVPGSLQIGLSEGHTAATLPNGVNFESGGSGGGVVYGGPVGAGDKQFSQTFSLPTDATGAFLPGGASPAGFGGMGAGGAGGVQQVYVVNMPGGGLDPQQQALLGAAAPIAGAGAQALVGAGGQAAVDAVHGASFNTLTPTHSDTALATLVREGNPNALAKAAGLTVQDFTRDGGLNPDQVQGPAKPYDASGRLFSDTTDLVTRTFTDLTAQVDAMRSQTVDVMNQVKDKLADKALGPIVTQGVSAGFSGLSPSTFTGMGTAIGQAAAPPIAQAVSAAVPAGGSTNSGADAATGLINNVGGGLGGVFGMAGGGLVSGGTPGVDSVPIMAQQNEWMLNTDDVARLGGARGVARFVGGLRSGTLKMMASGGSVGGKRIGNDTVGADFLGVSEVPIIGTIVNLLIKVLLKVIGVDIEVRDTLNHLGDDFRTFRGDAFKAFDAQGRLLSDTSALMDRSSTSTETAADERIRILKIVIEALIKYIIEKVIVPLIKAVANAAIQAVASGAGAAISTSGGGPAGGIASSFISSAGQAGVEIAAQVGTDFALAISSTLIDVLTEGLQSLLPDLMQTIFSGQLLGMIFTPLSLLLTSTLGGFLSVLTALLGGVGGAAMLPFGGLLGGFGLFDEGGIASGTGFLPKGIDADELVLSPTETDMFGRLVSALERNGVGGGGSRTVHAPITVMEARRETPQDIQDRILKHMS